jgi:transposase-like protein
MTLSVLDDLKARWGDLKDVPRARAVHKIHEQGKSLRSLAKELNCSPSLLGRLDRLAQAPGNLLSLIEDGKISTREALRQAESEKKARAAEVQRALDQERNQAAENAAAVIRNWLEEQNLWPAHRENVLAETRMIVASNEANGTLPKITVPEGTPLAPIIERTRPLPAKADPEPTEVGSVAWYAVWLARWTFFAYPDAYVRDRAIGLALNAETRGDPLPKIRKK